MTAAAPATSVPETVSLPVAVRAHTTRLPQAKRTRIRTSTGASTKPAGKGSASKKSKKRPRAWRDPGPSGSVLVFDTETTVDTAQALLFACWRYYQPDQSGLLACVDEGLFHADDLPQTNPAGLDVLRRHAARAVSAATGQTGVRLLSRTEFVNRVLYPAAWENQASVVGFNLPFDLSRIAIDAAEGRGSNLRGFSLTLSPGNAAKGFRERRHVPRVTVKHLDSHAAFISFSTAYASASPWRGDFVDLRTLAFGLTATGHGLDSACRAFGVPGKARVERHGVITPGYIDYCRVDVERTWQLFETCRAELDKLNLPIRPAQVYSPASLAKAALRAQGITPHGQREQPLPPEVVGWFMSAFYGGRAECRIRCTEVPVSLVDFLSMYPTLFALMGVHRFNTAERLGTKDCADEFRRLAETITLERLFDPALWPQLRGIALVRPDADLLPVRTRYDDRKPTLNIGLNHLTSDQPVWHTFADVIASAILTGKRPTILRAIRLTAHGQLASLTPWRMPGGRVLDPATEACWPAMVEHRQRLAADTTLSRVERDRARLFLKIAANAGGFGVYAEYNRQDIPTGTTVPVTVYSADAPFDQAVAAPEDPGRNSCPPLAAIITGGARLMLAMLERSVTDQGGSWAFADTDSMAIVSTPDGGLIPCDGGPHADDRGLPCVRALSHQQVDDIRAAFAELNPYDRDVVADGILKRELDAFCFAVAAKRYALYRYDADGLPRLVPADEHEPCSHGLGHLLNPADPDQHPDADQEQEEGDDWIVDLWERQLAQRLAPQLAATLPDPDWHTDPALSKVAVTSPHTLKSLRHHNDGLPYREVPLIPWRLELL